MRIQTEALLSALRHRGPDDQGAYEDPAGRAMLVHTRLAILDLSPAGHQPMELVRGPGVGLWIVFNGEIYNFRELREELAGNGVIFQTQTDTEVILQLYAREGIRCVDRLRGMFAFALWDEAAGRAFLARDPLGIKPLYLAPGADGSLSFSSEIRALVAAGLCGREIDAAGLWSYFRFGSVAEPLTILQGVTQLPAGHALVWEGGGIRQWAYSTLGSGEDDPVAWSPPARPDPHPLDPGRATVSYPAMMRSALEDSIRAHLVSDVPVGVFLSGGMDSTALAFLVRNQGSAELRTFSLGFKEEAYDESSVAARTAQHLGTLHQSWVLGAAEGKGLLKEFFGRLDQPTIDGFNTFCVSKLARQGGCKVVLSGLGGDELLGGYTSFTRVPTLVTWHRRLGWLPGTRQLVAAALSRSRSPVRRRVGEFLGGLGGAGSAWEACRSLFTEAEATVLVKNLLGTSPPRPSEIQSMSLPTIAEEAVGVLELTRYMRNQLLRDSDVLSMCHGLELRVPFVDGPLLETLRGVPYPVRFGTGKRLLAAAVPELPAWVTEQKKKGFTVPYQEWLGDDWKSEVAPYLHGIAVDPRKWYQLWAVYAFKRWRQEVLGEA